ncbi:MAG: CBS domain-containing protein, partial [Gammaproteobacteria bacterium]
EDRVKGIFTDGDLRRMLEQNHDIHTTLITEVMTHNCKVISEDILAAEAMRIMQEKKINALIVVDEAMRATGALNMHDIIHAGIV